MIFLAAETLTHSPVKGVACPVAKLTVPINEEAGIYKYYTRF
jgi:hypothetical protein